MEGLFAIIGVILGYLLGMYQKGSKNPVSELLELKKRVIKPKSYAEPFIIEPDEVGAENEEMRNQEEEDNDISLNGVLNKLGKDE